MVMVIRLSVRLLCRGTSAAALKRLGENVLCLRLLRHDRLGATNFGLGAAGNDSSIGRETQQNWSGKGQNWSVKRPFWSEISDRRGSGLKLRAISTRICQEWGLIVALTDKPI